MKEVRIENWHIDRDPFALFLRRREPPPLVLYGEVYDHPSFPDGKMVVTSIIKKFNVPEYVITQNTKYLLGKKSDRKPMATYLDN